MLQAIAEADVTVLLVEDDALTRRVLSLEVERDASLHLQGALHSVKSACDWLDQHPVDVLVVDLGLPDGSGIEVIRYCAKRYPATHILVLTTSSEEDNVVASIEAGASGYLLKDVGRMDIVRSIRDLQEGDSPVSQAVVRHLIAKVRGPHGGGQLPIVPILTKREMSVMVLIERGDTYAEMARHLSLAIGTVQTHIKNIYDKLGVHSRCEAVYKAYQLGLLPTR